MTLKLYNQDEVQKSTYARTLLLGPAKTGKSSCVAATSPRPFIINADPPDALHFPAAVMKAKFDAVNVTNRREWEEACSMAVDRATEGLNETIVVDTLSLLCESLLEDCKTTLRGFDVWTARDESVMKGIRTILDAPAHLIIISHLDARSDGPAGVMPVIGGKQLAVRLPALLSDWVLFDMEPGRNPERCFVLGAQKNWNHSGRNLKGSKLIEADVGLLLDEMGFAAAQEAAQ